MDLELDRVSRKISYLLRHDAAFIDGHGWAKVTAVIEEVRKKYPEFNRAYLEQIVREDAKGRYAFDRNGLCIRANQGHSVPVDVGLLEAMPPEVLYHGTATRFLDSIFKEGLTGQTRLYVHLSKDVETAYEVGKRHGKSIVLKVDAKQMAEEGVAFFLSENCVWLTKYVAPCYLELAEERGVCAYEA